MKVRQTDFSKGSVRRAILEVALPMTAAQLLNLLYNVVDRIYIARIPGQGALALTGVGLCFPILMMVTAFSNLYGTGGSPLATILRGKGDKEEAQRIMNTSYTMLLLTGLTVTVLGILFHRPILYLFGASDVTFPFASEYITVYLLGSTAVMVTLGMNPFINSQGFGQTGMLTVLLGAVANIVLDPVFIFVLGLGVRGAAIATVLSQFLSAAWVLRFLSGAQSEMKLRLCGTRPQWPRVKRIIGLGLTGFVVSFTNSAVQVACNATLQQFGGDLYVGVMTVLGSVRDIFTLPLMGFFNGAAPVMSYNYGARAFERVKAAIRFITLVGVTFTMLIWGAVSLFPQVFILVFTDDASLLQAAVPALHIYFFGFVFMSLQFVGQTVFVALGKSKKAVFFSIFRKLIIVTPLTLLLPRLWNLGVNGVFSAEPISNLAGGLACFLTMLFTVLPELRKQPSPLARP